MNTVELLQTSVDFAFDVLGMVTADLTQAQADWQPPEKASSISANYWHVISYVDFVLEKILKPCDDKPFQSDLPSEICMHEVQVALSDLHQRAGEVRRAFMDWLSSCTPADLDVEMNTSVGPLNVGQVVELWGAWHINVHCGEISVLKGCQGCKGYPW